MRFPIRYCRWMAISLNGELRRVGWMERVGLRVGQFTCRGMEISIARNNFMPSVQSGGLN